MKWQWGTTHEYEAVTWAALTGVDSERKLNFCWPAEQRSPSNNCPLLDNH